MYSFQKGSPRSQTGPEQGLGKQKLFGTAKSLPVSTNIPGSLTPVDVEQLRARLISAVPRRPQPNADALVFPHRTKAQERQWAAQRPAQVEMLPFLKRRSEYIKPENTQRVNLSPKMTFPSNEVQSIDPSSERGPSLLQLPRIPDHVKNRQVQLTQGSLRIPSPPKRTKSSSRSAITVSPLSYTPSSPLGSSLRFNSVEEVIHAKIYSPPDIVQTIRNNPHLGFLYVTSAAPKSSIKFDTYNLKKTFQDSSPDCIMDFCGAPEFELPKSSFSGASKGSKQSQPRKKDLI